MSLTSLDENILAGGNLFGIGSSLGGGGELRIRAAPSLLYESLGCGGEDDNPFSDSELNKTCFNFARISS